MKRATVPLAPGPEFDLIRRFLRYRPPLETKGVLVGPGDDCAVVRGDGVALSCDVQLEGVHFRREWLAPGEIGYRSVAAALSDLAATAARPIGVLVSLAVAGRDADGFAAALMDGAGEAIDRCGGALLGGNLSRSPGPLLVGVTVVGECPEPVLRTGAKEGDEVWVSGELGGSALAVALWQEGVEPPGPARDRFVRPRPRLREALWLAGRKVPAAMIDLSDGLAGDAAHLAAAGGVAVVLEWDRLPVQPLLRRHEAKAQAVLRLALSGGEDFELCFCARKGSVEPHLEEFEKEFGLPLTRVGRVEAGEGVALDRDGERQPLDSGGYQHFG
ncbi:MAG: thiamine-phosphate kinase [Longimicrobiaceae bacterium]